MEKIIDIVIDFETLSLQPNAALLQLAAVPFNRTAPGHAEMFKIPGISVFNEYIDLASCAVENLDFNRDTLEWWAQKDDALKNNIFLNPNRHHIGEVMAKFASWLEYVKSTTNAEIILWAQGSDMDIAILRFQATRHIRDFQQLVPYWHFRDARTFIIETKAFLDLPQPQDALTDHRLVYTLLPQFDIDKEGVPEELHDLGSEAVHNALFDAARTAWHLYTVFLILSDCRHVRLK